jgi:hypothetical protein
MHITAKMTFRCFVLSEGEPFTYIGVHTAEGSATMGAVAKAAQELVSAYYGKGWDPEIKLYKVSLHPPLCSRP